MIATHQTKCTPFTCSLLLFPWSSLITGIFFIAIMLSIVKNNQTKTNKQNNNSNKNYSITKSQNKNHLNEPQIWWPLGFILNAYIVTCWKLKKKNKNLNYFNYLFKLNFKFFKKTYLDSFTRLHSDVRKTQNSKKNASKMLKWENMKENSKLL